MKTRWVVRSAVLFGLLITGATGPGTAQEQPAAEVLEAAVLPLPTNLRADAGIVRWVDGRLERLRPSQNGMSCTVDDPDDDQFDVRCYNDDFWKVIARVRELRRDASSGAEAEERLNREIETGEVALPEAPTAGYRMLGPIAALDMETGTAGPGIAKWQSIHFPFHTAEEMGLTEERESSETALPGLMPFVMASGTWWSHVMIVHEPFD